MTTRSGLTILGDLQDQDIAWLSQNGSVHHLTQGDALMAAGQDIEHLYIVTNGSLSILVDERELAEAKEGDVLGEMSFVEKRPTSAAVVARTAARVLAVPRQALMNEFAANSAFAARFYRALAVFLSDRLRAMNPGKGRGPVVEGLADPMASAAERIPQVIAMLEGRAQAA